LQRYEMNVPAEVVEGHHNWAFATSRLREGCGELRPTSIGPPRARLGRSACCRARPARPLTGFPLADCRVDGLPLVRRLACAD
jgi:hypothetical protein